MSQLALDINNLFKPLSVKYEESPKTFNMKKDVLPMIRPLPVKMAILSLSDESMKNAAPNSKTFEFYKNVQEYTMEVLLTSLQNDLAQAANDIDLTKTQIKQALVELENSNPDNKAVTNFAKTIISQIDSVTDEINIILPKTNFSDIAGTDFKKATALEELKKLAKDFGDDVAIHIPEDKLARYNTAKTNSTETAKTLTTIYNMLIKLKYGLTDKISTEIIYGLSWCNERCMEKVPDLLSKLVRNRLVFYSDIYKSLPANIKASIFMPYTEENPEIPTTDNKKLVFGNKKEQSEIRKQLEGKTSSEIAKYLQIHFPYDSVVDFRIVLAKLRTVIRFYFAQNAVFDIRNHNFQNASLPLTAYVKKHLGEMLEITSDSFIFDTDYARMQSEPNLKFNTSLEIIKSRFNLHDIDIAKAIGVHKSTFSKKKDTDNPYIQAKLSLLYNFTYEFFAGATTIPNYGKHFSNYPADTRSEDALPKQDAAMKLVENFYSSSYGFPIIMSIDNPAAIVSRLLSAFSAYLLAKETGKVLNPDLPNLPDNQLWLLDFLMYLYENRNSLNEADFRAVTQLLKYAPAKE